MGRVAEPGAVGAGAPVQMPALAGASSPASPAPTGRRASAPAAPARTRGTVHVDEERLDRLLETIGELVIAEASVSRSFRKSAAPATP